jgi:hypothetical protein
MTCQCCGLATDRDKFCSSRCANEYIRAHIRVLQRNLHDLMYREADKL